ncbi:hypothetical protein F383_32388 [Gossypium arboreum]|uniref:Uncharacterized protein n=1 Tax=Gossypium arboreum TaxID=29729 RepID=A0A0B0PPE0_GOSAR|nr:hypothetical protein F383_32388 [Gossypium arboreum]
MEIFNHEVIPASELIPMAVFQYFLLSALRIPFDPLLGCFYRLWNAQNSPKLAFSE